MPAPLQMWSPPALELRALDTLWLQVAGTRCNIACRHCFVHAGPNDERLAMMTVDEVRRAVDDAAALGVRDIYFTGGEPFLHPDIDALIEIALATAPLTILTNGLFFDEHTSARMARIFESHAYSFDLRVSLDGATAAENDPLRGKGTFDEILAGLRRLASHGLSPVVTVVEHHEGAAAAHARATFLSFLRAAGLERPRVKFLPLLRLGREERRTRPYRADERVIELDDADRATLGCASGRMVTAQGVWPCPILVLDASARLGASLRDALGPATLASNACYTCQVDGLSCRT